MERPEMRISWEVLESLGPEFDYFLNQELLPKVRLNNPEQRLDVTITARDACIKTTLGSQLLELLRAIEVDITPYYFEFGSQRDLARVWGWEIGDSNLLTREGYATVGSFMTDSEKVIKTYSKKPAFDLHELGLQMGWEDQNGAMKGASRGSYRMARLKADTDLDSYRLLILVRKKFRDRVMRRRMLMRLAGKIGLSKAVARWWNIEDDGTHTQIYSSLGQDGGSANQRHQDADLSDAMVLGWMRQHRKTHILRELDPNESIIDDLEVEREYSQDWILNLHRMYRYDMYPSEERTLRMLEVNTHNFILEVNPLIKTPIHVYRQRLEAANVVHLLTNPPEYLVDNIDFTTDVRSLRRGPKIFTP